MFDVAATASSRILAAYMSRLLASSPIVVSKLDFQHSSSIDGLGLLAVTNAMVRSTWRAGIAALWNASVDDTASTYFHATHRKTGLCKTRLRMYT
jgi:hypothetical protein